MSTATDWRARRWMWWWVACYGVLVSVIVGSLFYAKQRAHAELGTPESVGKWQAFREGVEHKDAELGPVERRVPKSTEPPALVLMRDYFGVCMAGALLFSTLLYWVIAWFVTGALAPTAGTAPNESIAKLSR